MSCWFVVARVFRRGDFLVSLRKTLASKEASYKFVAIARQNRNRIPLQRLKPASTRLRFGRAEVRPSDEARDSACGTMNLRIRSGCAVLAPRQHGKGMLR